MSTITTSIKFSFTFDEQKLVNDLANIEQAAWAAHFNTGGYNGEWNGIPLYSIDGTVDNIFALDPDSKSDAFLPTPFLLDCHYFQEVLSYFQCPLQSVRLLKLKAGSYIKPHTDHELGYNNQYFRLHIPIITNELVEFVLDEKRLIMNPGECWYINASHTHSVHNKSTEDRIHLVIDGIRNAWTDSLFFSHAPEASFNEAPSKNNYTQEELQRMIEELTTQDSPAAEMLIQEFSALLTKRNTLQ